jgi:hypothetical protein
MKYKELNKLLIVSDSFNCLETFNVSQRKRKTVLYECFAIDREIHKFDPRKEGKS